ncbi:hypothetical protein M413DRAFT_447053 [Hebeloma cylindrosporum]|uniref:Uncharacterized protein n=1 Tax=Hebeloma cylindrosporum TaxID=76867 RepID=A0A0C3C7M0_HEBCY|nr:hypothetical protein M413DRAFT_447053 [Hebeloma cylindrosporum h7]
MARGAHVSPPTTSLPKVEFEVIHDEKLKLPGGIHDKQAESFGYNHYAEFRRPEYYIRHIEPLESDLAKTVEYDMDEQDQEWLDAVNAEPAKIQIGGITQESFEIIMDRLEKEWFDLTKNIPKPDFAMPSEDSTCAICDDSEGENSNAIVFCDGCNLAVHQDCYGVPYIPEGQWLCRKCTVSPENPVECILCPNEGGAFKQTVHGEWVHLLCAIWIPETRVANDVFMEPVTGIERISKQRWKLRCTICDIREGACIQCTKPSCFVAFHATCARKDKLLLPMKSAHGAEPASLTCFCDRHLPQEQQDARAAALLLDETHQRAAPNTQLSKSARAYAKTYKPGPPLVPHIITERILKYVNRIKIWKKTETVWQLCRYWSLKREARRGAPLLKRLHLEPWTAAAGTKVLSEEEKLMKLDQLVRLRQDLINVQKINSFVRDREYRKLRQNEIIYEVLSEALFPSHAHLRTAFEKIAAIDRNDYFRNPVSKSDVPDYYEIIKNPLCWTEIDAKLDKHQYWDLQSFRDDIELVANNALLYNKHSTAFHKAAARVKKEGNTLLNLLEPWKMVHPPHAQPPINGHASRENDEGDTDNHSAAPEMPPPLGDLEPPLDILELLMSSDLIKEDLNMELDVDPVTALLNYELARMKPAPPDPSPPAALPRQRKKKPKPKRDRKAEAERAKANKAKERESAAARAAQLDKEEEEEAERAAALMGDEENRELGDLEKARRRELHATLDASAGFRAPRTRGAMAAAAAFEAEAHGSTPISGSSSISVPASAGPSRPPDSTDKSHWKRASIASMSQTSIPRVVNDVDNRDSFNMFNAGWILPPDQKRGGRVPTDRPALPPPRKRQKTDHASSRLSNVSTAPSDNFTLRRTPPWSSDPPDIKHEAGIPMDVDDENALPLQNPIPPSASRVASPDNDEAITNLVTQPNGVVIIEKLDTPAIRREKHMRRKAEKQRLAGVAASAPVSVDSSGHQPLPPPISGVSSFASPPPTTGDSVATSQQQPLRLPAPEASREQQLHEDFDSELSELSDDETDADAHGEPDDELQEEMEAVVVQPPPAPSLPPPPPPVEPAAKEGPATRKKSSRKKTLKIKGEPFEDGTIVWAKAESFPWWPAVVHADTSELVPGNILVDHKEKRQKRKIKLYIVQFYDKTSSWASVAKDKLQYLGEDKDLDQDLLTNNSKQKWKSSASKPLCRDAYKKALSEMDMEEGGHQHLEMSEDGDAAEKSE